MRFDEVYIGHAMIPLMMGLTGILLIVFPRKFIEHRDARFLGFGYQPIEDHPMRSPRMYRIFGVLLFIAALIIFAAMR